MICRLCERRRSDSDMILHPGFKISRDHYPPNSCCIYCLRWAGFEKEELDSYSQVILSKKMNKQSGRLMKLNNFTSKKLEVKRNGDDVH